MDRSEALDYLDLDSSASDDEINQRFRELVHESHPDTEGSDEEMAKLIEARDTALEETPTELEVVQSVIENTLEKIR